MKSKKIIGITGSIATGKSTVSKIIIEEGYELIDADKISHELMEIGNINYNSIIEEFGQEVLNEDKSINRKYLGNIVFNNEERLKILNSLTHKNIFNRIKEEISKSDREIIFIDVPLLIELMNTNPKLEYLTYDEIWLVYTNLNTQIERLMERNNYSREDALKIINSQMSIEDKKQFADVIIDNTRDFDYLKKQVLERLELL